MTFPMKGDILNAESQFYDMFFARVTYFYCFLKFATRIDVFFTFVIN